MKRKLLLAALCLLAVRPASAQVFDEVKAAKLGQKSIVAKMQLIDQKTVGRKNVATIGVAAGRKQIDRIWETSILTGHFPAVPVGYAYASPVERVEFACAYENWLRENGESAKDAIALVPYAHRLNFAEQWWTRHSVARFRKHETSDWAAASLVDAGYLIAEAAKEMQIGGEDISRNENEQLAVYTKALAEVKKEKLAVELPAGSNNFRPALVAMDKNTLGCSINVGGKRVRRLWESGYGGTTAAERANFAFDFLAFLNVHQPGNNSYRQELVWAEQWWTDNSESYRAQEPGSSLSVSPYKAWARDSIVDAELLGYLANQQLGNLNPDANKHFQLMVAHQAEAARNDYESNDSKVPRSILPN